MSDALAITRAALAGETAWLVGGAVRDQLLGREVDDVDLAIPGDPRRCAKALARATGAAAFQLSHAFGAWRVVGPDHAWHVDLVRFRNDRRKGNAITQAGWDLLRYTWHDLDGEPARVLAEITCALGG